MKSRITPLIALLAVFGMLSAAHAQDTTFDFGDEEVFEYNVGEVNLLTGEGANLGGFLFPSLFVMGTGGVAENKEDIPRLASSHHDPQNALSIQGIEIDVLVNVQDKITGLIAASGFQVENERWEAELEEAFLHFIINDDLAVGGGQYLNTFGFQADRHQHTWDMINQNLVNSRMFNEGHLFMQGGEVIFRTPNSGILTLGIGGVNNHSHGHDHDHDHEGEEHEEHEEHGHHDEGDHDDHDEHEEEGHLDYHDAEFQDWVVSADYKFRLPFDESTLVSTSFAAGENGFGGDQVVYGAGVEKIWNAHDHGNGPEFCANAFMFRTEFIGRHTEAFHEDGDAETFNDYGVSTLLAYGLTETSSLAIRHDWVSEVEGLELEGSHRISPAFTTFLDPNQRIRMRIQYDNVQNDSVGTEHVGWLQFQLQWGGPGGVCQACRNPFPNNGIFPASNQ